MKLELRGITKKFGSFAANRDESPSAAKKARHQLTMAARLLTNASTQTDDATTATPNRVPRFRFIHVNYTKKISQSKPRTWRIV